MPDETTPTRIKRLRARGFRCIKELDLEFPPFTVVIGPNGAGKSTLLGAFQLLSRLARSDSPAAAFTEYGGFNAALCWLAPDDVMAFDMTAGDDAVELRYRTELMAVGNAHFVAGEQLQSTLLSVNGRRDIARKRYVLPEDAAVREGARPRLTDEPGYILRLCLHFGGGFFEWCADDGTVDTREARGGAEAVLPKVAIVNTEARRLVNAFERTSFLRASSLLLDRKMWVSQELGPSQQLLPDGSNLLSVLYSMRTERRELYEEFTETLRVAFPELESMEFPLVGRGFASLDWHQKGVDRPFGARQLSDGTLRLLWLITMLFTVPDDGLVLIDEPEISLHPQWLMVLVSLLRQTSARTQIIVATHSDQIVRWLEPHELLVADIEDGVSRFRWGSDMDLEAWLDEYTLDRLWHMGELGGRQ